MLLFPSERKHIACRALIPARRYAKGGELPIAIAMTEFHLIILFRERYSALCLLNEKIVLSENLQGGGRGMLGLAYDPVMELIYAYSPRVIYRIDPKHETRDVWQLYLDTQQYSKVSFV